MAYAPEDLMALLDELGIAVTYFTHPPLRTVADARAHRQDMRGGHAKNLYLRDRKKRNYLVIAEENQPIDLKRLATAMGADRLTFGSEERLMQYLGVIPGAVTPFAVMNDESREVAVFLDASLAAMEYANFHPLTNEATITIALADLMRFFRHTQHDVVILPLKELGNSAS